MQGSVEYPPQCPLSYKPSYISTMLPFCLGQIQHFVALGASSPPKLFDLVYFRGHFAAFCWPNPPFDRQENVAHLLHATNPRVQAPSSPYFTTPANSRYTKKARPCRVLAP